MCCLAVRQLPAFVESDMLPMNCAMSAYFGLTCFICIQMQCFCPVILSLRLFILKKVMELYKKKGETDKEEQRDYNPKQKKALKELSLG